MLHIDQNSRYFELYNKSIRRWFPHQEAQYYAAPRKSQFFESNKHTTIYYKFIVNRSELDEYMKMMIHFAKAIK